MTKKYCPTDPKKAHNLQSCLVPNCPCFRIPKHSLSQMLDHNMFFPEVVVEIVEWRGDE